ncbi:zinc-binding metallopeptidase family protein, partial [Siminovitchia fortis]|uniref:hypothetical protein n=1 Tax=Siminovitchia fortis TaxID=254758 RepID=UPI0036F227C3
MVGSTYYLPHLPKQDVHTTLLNFNLHILPTNSHNPTQFSLNTPHPNSNLPSHPPKPPPPNLPIHHKIIHIYPSGASDHIPFYQASIHPPLFISQHPLLHPFHPSYHTPPHL